MTPEEAFEEFGGKIYAYLRKIGISPEDAQDGVQEVFKKALFSKNIRWNEAGPFLYRVAYHWAVDLWRKPRMMSFKEEIFSSPFRYEDDFLSPLSAEDRSLIILHYEEGFSIDEISEMTKLPGGTIKSKLHRAKKRVKEQT
ncbi:MAG TPA: RNA polymerase sigma factor [Caldisericia bacterium]|nr:RNA polymerase sigma factor [Caldisericia bacterium]